MHTHLVALNKKHSTLEHKIEQEMRRPVTDTGRIKHYKLEKLHIKRQISRLAKETETAH